MAEPDEHRAATVTMYPDGPLIVRGDFEVRTVEGETVVDRRTVALCRCGRSAAKPFCDGSHSAGPAQGPQRVRAQKD
jgi:CDGSH-type Zn-finger protein